MRGCHNPKKCEGEDDKDLEIFKLKCELSQNEEKILSCPEDRYKNFHCSKKCPGEGEKQAEIAQLECQLAKINAEK